MNYSRITLLKDQHRTQRKEMAELLGVTTAGYDNMMKKETFTVKNLEIIANYFKVPITYFFDENKTLTQTEEPGNCIECYKKEGIIDSLLNQLDQKELKIQELNREIGRSEPGKRRKAS